MTVSEVERFIKRWRRETIKREKWKIFRIRDIENEKINGRKIIGLLI